jgi:hypothetical protein
MVEEVTTEIVVIDKIYRPVTVEFESKIFNCGFPGCSATFIAKSRHSVARAEAVARKQRDSHRTHCSHNPVNIKRA